MKALVIGSGSGPHFKTTVCKKCRPLVVIDPEDRDTLERLRREVMGPLATASNLLDWKDALYSLVAPPKPDEPTGLGAVVVDADGKRYVRCSEGGDRWHCPDDDTGGSDNYYADIAAVKVLSEGVTS